jgi:signal transduction histidine kinase
MITMFKSARIKLTLFYLVILVAFSLVVTIGVRVLAEREYLNSNRVQRGEVRQLILGLPDFTGQRPNTSTFIDVQQAQEDLVRQRLNQELVIINVVALLAAGLLSYWFAGRTLKPIEEAHVAQARFASDASHELRTPLTNLRLENEVFLRQKQFSEAEARELIHSNLEEVQRLEGLSSNLLALAQYDNVELHMQTMPVVPLVDDALKTVARTAKAKRVTYKNNAHSGRIVGNHESLLQLLGILLDNAIKYGPEGGAVTVGGEKRDGGMYALWVEDEGPGITEEDMPHIFERLYRGDKARSGKAGGYGLGLSLAQAITVANNGELSVQNISAKGGARFTIQLPIVR